MLNPPNSPLILIEAMEKKLKINWWIDSQEEINPLHEELLKEEGFNRAHSMLEEGYTSGTLSYELDDTCYSGSWSLEDEQDLKVIQLCNSEGEPVGLYQYDANDLSAEQAIEKIEIAFKSAEGDDDIMESAEQILEMHGIIRIFAEITSVNI